MQRNQSRLTDDAWPGLVIAPQRLKQVLWACLAGIAVSVSFGVGNPYGGLATLLYLTFGVVSLCLWLAHSGRVRTASVVLIATLVLLASGLIYNAAGIHDEAVCLFPGILVFAGMFGTRTQFIALLVFIIAFLGFLVCSEVYQWHSQAKPNTSFASFVNLSVIILATAFFSYILSADLHEALGKLSQSEAALLQVNEKLERRVAQRTVQLEDANAALKESLFDLERTQAELMQAEKLASLGAMVAGISHELNTPIGNALLSATSMEKLFDGIVQSIQSGTIKRSQLEDFASRGKEMAELVTRSNKRAADLIVSFKQVAIDQSSEQRRRFDLREVVDDNLAPFQPMLRQRGVKADNVIARGIDCDSFPGPLGQVIANLIQNALLHAFEDNRSGLVTIAAHVQADQVTLTVNDDGSGMAPAVQARIFDPFYTTKLGKGGSGLGLSISHRLVSSVLGGSITAASMVGQGTTFTLILPMRAPFPM